MTVIDFQPVAPAVPTQLQTSIQQTLARTVQIPSGPTVEVGMDGATVVLRGSVADERERKLAEAMARMTPGVREVRNELVPRETTTGQGQ
jgi:osmotically-inducible protein OsmY